MSSDLTRQAQAHFDAGGTVSELIEAKLALPRVLYKLHLDWKQERGDVSVHHPQEKIAQIHRVLGDQRGLRIYEAFSGFGYTTAAYREHGKVISRTKESGDPLLNTYSTLVAALAGDKFFDVIDIDSYGSPATLLDAGIVGAMKDVGHLFLTIPSPTLLYRFPTVRYQNSLYYGTASPDIEDIVKFVRINALKHSFKSSVMELQKLDSVYRLVIKMRRCKSGLGVAVKTELNTDETNEQEEATLLREARTNCDLITPA